MSVLLDFDGTLADTMPELEQLAVDVLSRCFPALDPDEREAHIRTWYRSSSGVPFSRQLELLDIAPKSAQRALEEFQRRKLHIYDTCAPIQPIIYLLRRHVERDLPVGIVTSTERVIVIKTLTRWGIHPDSSVEVYGIEVGDKLHQIREFTRGVSDSIVFIGDSDHDRIVSGAAKVDFVHVRQACVIMEGLSKQCCQMER